MNVLVFFSLCDGNNLLLRYSLRFDLAPLNPATFIYFCFFFLILQTSSSRQEYIFKEISGTEHTSYQSMLNPDWYLALTKQGEAKPGPKTKRGQRAVSFMKDSLL